MLSSCWIFKLKNGVNYKDVAWKLFENCVN